MTQEDLRPIIERHQRLFDNSQSENKVYAPPFCLVFGRLQRRFSRRCLRNQLEVVNLYSTYPISQ